MTSTHTHCTFGPISAMNRPAGSSKLSVKEAQGRKNDPLKISKMHAANGILK